MGKSIGRSRGLEALRNAYGPYLWHCPEREGMIIRRWLGFDDKKPESLSAIARSVGLSRDRVRQLRDRAMRFIDKNRERLDKEY